MNENDLLTFWTNFLRLDGFRVVHVRTDLPSDPVRLTVIPTTVVALCPTVIVPATPFSAATNPSPLRISPWGPRPSS
jgi:hypothetical protein